MGVILLLSLQFQTLPIQIQVQTLPLTTVFAVIFFPFVIGRTPRSPLLTMLILFLSFALLHSLVALMVDLLSGQSDNRFVAWLRQSSGLTAGVIVFLVFRMVFLHLSYDQISRWIMIGALPAIGLSLLNIVWGALGKEWAGAIVTGIRDVVSPDGYTAPLRASGFASEPAAWATSLVVTVLPVLLVHLSLKKRSIWVVLFLIASGLAFAWTFSTIGLMLLVAVLILGTLLGPRRKLLLVFFSSFILLLSLAFVAFPGNQILRHARSLALGQANQSFTDRYYSAFGPFIETFDSYSIIGYGLGGVSTHYREVVPTVVQTELFSTKWKDYPNLTIITGRIFAETGAIGFVLFLFVMFLTFRELKTIMRRNKNPESDIILSSIRLGWIAVCVSVFISIGPYQTPYLWLWMAFIDSRYVMSNASQVKMEANVG